MNTTNTLQFILDKFQVKESRSPIRLPIGRNDLAALFGELHFLMGVEIGVESGEYSEVLLSTIPNLHLIMIDPWRPYKGYRDHVTQEKLDEFMKEAHRRTSTYTRWVIRDTSVGALKMVRDETQDFVYIDGNHDFLHVTQDICYWLPKLRKGGILAGHDYRRVKGQYINHVKDVVEAYTYSHHISPWFVCAGDSAPSWFWVVE